MFVFHFFFQTAR